MGNSTKSWMPQVGMVVGILAGVHFVRASGDYLLTQIALIVVSCLAGVVLATVIFKLWRVWRHKEKWYYGLKADIFGVGIKTVPGQEQLMALLIAATGGIGGYCVRVSGDYLFTKIALIVASCLTGAVLGTVISKVWGVWRHKEKWYYGRGTDIFAGDGNVVTREKGGAEVNGPSTESLLPGTKVA